MTATERITMVVLNEDGSRDKFTLSSWVGIPRKHELMWLDRPMPLYGLHGVKTPGGAVTTVLVALGLLGCLWLLRGELSPRGARLS